MTSFTHGYHDSGPFHSPQALAWGDSAPESGKPFKWFSRVGDNEDPKLKLGENEKGRLDPRVEIKQTVKDVMIMNSAATTWDPNKNLTNAESVRPVRY